MSIIKPAATVLIVKDHPVKGIQVLLLKRNARLKFAPDFWVFPGGRIDKNDGSFETPDLENTARKAAVREAYEEAQIALHPENLKHFCHWTTPSGGNKRFSTWFFHCKLYEGNGDVTIDDSEIVDYLWIHPREALQKLSAKQLDLLPPTFVTLNRIKNAQSYGDVSEEFERTGVVRAAPVTVMDNGLFYCLYKGDAGYDRGDIHQTSTRHRLIIDQKNGQYQFEYEHCERFPPVNGGVNF